MQVKNLTSNKSNKGVSNQFEVVDNEGNIYFQSYNSIIVKKTIEGRILLDKMYWNYSKTTSKHRNKFLNETTKETLEKINNGIYKLVNLN